MSHKDPKRVTSSSYYRPRAEPHGQHVERGRDRYYGTTSTSERYQDRQDGLKAHGGHSSSKSHYLSTPSSSHRYSAAAGTSGSSRRQSYSQQHSSQNPDYHHYESRGSAAVSSSHYTRTSGKETTRHYYDRSDRSPGRTTRRVPPPLTPPHHVAPIKPAASSPSSRYRRAPPEDHHASYRVTREPKRSRLETSGHGRTDANSDRRARKRTSLPEESSSTEAKKKKETHLDQGNTVVVDEVTGDVDDEPQKNDDKMKEENHDTENAEEKGDSSSPNTNAKTLLKLYCPYCDMSCVTLREFVYHTKSYQHTTEMTKVVGNMKKKLAQLRTTQREEQKELEKSEDGKKDLSDTTSYCRVCELNFRTDPKLHETQDLHNQLKSLVDRTCEVCNIQFRFWKVYIYHVVALEHVKRVALQEVTDKEAKGECIIKGTNLTEEELGMDLMEQRTVFYCNACARYLPIRDGPEETKSRHCMSIGHIKLVGEYRQRIRRAERRSKAGHSSAGEDTDKKVADEVDTTGNSADANEDNGNAHKTERSDSDTRRDRHEERDVNGSSERGVKREEVDEDEIQLHAEEDDSVSANSC